MIVAGVDLAGPCNASQTAIAWFTGDQGQLSCAKTVAGADDQLLFEILSGLAARDELVVGLDAPLSYNPGGGDRPGDSQLRRRLVLAGLRSGSVMTPTMTRMAYLTLRGISVARALETIRPRAPRIVEVHPGPAGGSDRGGAGIQDQRPRPGSRARVAGPPRSAGRCRSGRGRRPRGGRLRLRVRGLEVGQAGCRLVRPGRRSVAPLRLRLLTTAVGPTSSR
jgi:predicted nuclease with RNAse H fold